MQNAPLGAFCNAFGLHSAIIGLENQFLVFLRAALLHRFYCMYFEGHKEHCISTGKKNYFYLFKLCKLRQDGTILFSTGLTLFGLVK